MVESGAIYESRYHISHLQLVDRLLTSIRRTPSRRMLSRYPDCYSCDHQSFFLQARIRKDSRVLPHKRFPWTPRKRQEGPERTLLQLPSIRYTVSHFAMGLYILWTSLVYQRRVFGEENGDWTDFHGCRARSD